MSDNVGSMKMSCESLQQFDVDKEARIRSGTQLDHFVEQQVVEP